VEKKDDKLGMRASDTAPLTLENVRVPADLLLGEEGEGFKYFMMTLDGGRISSAAVALGIAVGAYRAALEYAKKREQFGRPIARFQAVRFMLADMATQVEAARALVYAAARHVDAHDKGLSKVSSMCKLFATDMAMKVTVDAVQVLGGYGYMRDYPVEKMMRDAKILQIYEGTNQIQRNVIGQELNKEYN